MRDTAKTAQKPAKRPDQAKGKLTPEQEAALALADTIKVREKPVKKPKKEAKPTPPAKTAAVPKTEPAKRGRPSTYDQAIANEICERLSEGEPLRQICRDAHMPAWRTVYHWIEAHEEFAARIAHARDLGEEAIGQECLEIADDAANDWMEKNDPDNPGFALNGEHIQRSKLRIETRLKLLAKWNPKKWGDKVDLNHGGQENNPVQVAAKVVIVPQKQAAAVETKPLTKERE